MNKEIERARCETLIEWGDLYKRGELPGGEEVGYLMHRTARLIAKMAEIKVPDLPPEPRVREAPVEEMRDG
jgi:hypothetical protein